MKLNTFLVLSFFILLSACKTAEILLDPDLKAHSEGMTVAGRHKLKFKRVMDFGDYTVIENKNAWPAITNWQLSAHLLKSNQNIQFDLLNKTGQSNEFYGKSTLERVSLQTFKDISIWLPDIDLYVDDVFTGGIVTPSGDWEFMLFDANRITVNRAQGLLVNDQSVFKIEEIRRLEGVKHWIETDRYGYAIKSGGETVATVQIFGKGKIWIKETVDEETKHLLATVAAALLVHQPTDAG